MTVEELKIEAAKLGYNIIKKPETVKLLPCVCGKNRREMWYDSTTRMNYYKCVYCGFCGGGGKSERDAKIKWNKAVEEAVENGEVQEL